MLEDVDIFKILTEGSKAIGKRTVLVKKFEMKETLPCFTTRGYIRFAAQADKELGEVIPVISLKFPPGRKNYLIKDNILTLQLLNRTITFFPSGRIAVTNTRDKEEAKEILQRIADIINEAYRDYLKHGKPSIKEIEASTKLDWMDIYDCLPKTNCGKCGFQTCSAFSTSLLQGEIQLAKCTTLKEEEFTQNLEKLKERIGGLMLKSLGWK